MPGKRGGRTAKDLCHHTTPPMLKQLASRHSLLVLHDLMRRISRSHDYRWLPPCTTSGPEVPGELLAIVPRWRLATTLRGILASSRRWPDPSRCIGTMEGVTRSAKVLLGPCLRCLTRYRMSCLLSQYDTRSRPVWVTFTAGCRCYPCRSQWLISVCQWPLGMSARLKWRVEVQRCIYSNTDCSKG